MSDPRFTDPRSSDPRLSDPQLSDPVLRDSRTGGAWGWVAGIAVLALIAFVLVAGWNGNQNTASNTSPSASAPITTGSAPRATPPSTTGSGATTPAPAPAPATPSAPRSQ